MLSIFDTRKELSKDVDLGNYYYFSNYFNDEDIAKILKLASNAPQQTGTVSTTVDLSYRSSKIKWLPKNSETKWI